MNEKRGSSNLPNSKEQTAKEIFDIKRDYNKILELLQQKKWQELDIHLHNIQNRHIIETMAYNSVNHIMPQNIQENAKNCLRFLEWLAKAKGLNSLVTWEE